MKFDDINSCEKYIRDRSDAHFILISSDKLGNIIVPEIDDLLQLDSAFIYNFSSNVIYKSWMQKCQKVTLFFTEF